MAEKISFALQKGGVGKTTSTVAVASILAATGRRVLVVDFDVQGNATKILANRSVYKFKGRTIMDAIRAGNIVGCVERVSENLDLIPADDSLAEFSRHIYTGNVIRPELTLRRTMADLENQYDYIFVDVGPTLGDTLINAIAYVDHVIIPVDLGDLAMEAMIRFVAFLDNARADGWSHADVLGILFTMRDRRSRYEREVAQGIRDAYGDLVFQTEIRRRTKIKEISAAGVNLNDATIIDYIDLTAEILNRGGVT